MQLCRWSAHGPEIRLYTFFLLALAGLTDFTGGQSNLIFPRLSFEENSLTGVAVLNPNSTSAVVTFTAYGQTGEMIEAETLVNPREITIEPGRQFADVTTSLFGSLPPETVAWFEAQSDSANLTGFFLYLDFPDFRFFDGADLPRRDTHLVFPDLRVGGGFATEINVVNPGAEGTIVELTLEGAGVSLAADPVLVPAKGVLRLDVRETFESTNGPAGIEALPDPSFLRLTSNQAVAGFAFVRQPAGDLFGLNAVPADELFDRLYFPQLAVGDIIRTELALENLSQQDILVTLTAHRENGELFGPEDLTTNPVSMALEAGQVQRLEMADTFGFLGDEVRQGWLEVSSTSQALLGALSYTLPQAGSLAAVATSRQGSRQAAFSHLATAAGFFTGIALLNPARLAVDVRIVAISQAGEILGTATLTLAPGERISQLLGVDLIPQAAGQSGGAVYVRSSIPIFMTSLFGRVEGSGVLANIPAQPVPVQYRPDAAVPQSRVSPSLAAVEPAGDLSFALQMAGEGMPIWKVNGVTGGNAQIGTIGEDGDFQASAATPIRLPLSITAETDTQTASASVDVLSRQVLLGDLGEVHSVAYLEGLARLFVAELGAGPSPQQGLPTGLRSVILDVTGPERQVIQQLEGEDVSKILGYRTPGGEESLLIAGRGTGQIFRLEIDPLRLSVIASGLNAPETIALDPRGDLLVAEADQLSRIDADRVQATGPAPQGDPPGSQSLLPAAARGIAVDACTGAIYFSDGDEQSIRRFHRSTAEVTTLVELTNPTQLLGLVRSGAPCPEGFHLLVVEPAAGQVTRVVPAEGQVSLFARAPGVQDLTFLPAGNPFGNAAVLLSEQREDGGQLEQLFVPGIYEPSAFNILAPSSCLGRVAITDPNLEAGIREALGIGPSEIITCSMAEGLIELQVTNLMITELDGLQDFVNLDTLRLDDNQVSDLTPLTRLTNLRSLFLNSNQINDIGPLAGLTGLQFLGLNTNPLSDLSPLAALTNLISLDLDSSLIVDIAPLADLKRLQVLDFHDNQVTDITPLAGLAGLAFLDFAENRVSDLSPLAALTPLRSIRASNNLVSDLTPLTELINLTLLFLTTNQISDISPLVANMGLGDGDTVSVNGNLLDAADCPDIEALVARGVDIDVAGALCP